MAATLQHCPDCQEEYVAGVAACVECGGVLQPGPLERFEKPVASRAISEGVGRAGATSFDRLLVELPGLQADHAVRALLAEDIGVRVVCQGAAKVYSPGQQPSEPFAVTLPVSVYVAAEHVDAAQEILASFQEGDVIGDQWSALEPGPAATDGADADPETVEVVEVDGGDAGDDSAAAAAPTSESTSLRTVVLLVVAGIILLFLFGR